MLKNTVALLVVLALAHVALAQQSAASPDGKLQATAKGTTLSLFDAATGKEILSVKTHTDAIIGVAFSPDGRSVASVGKDKKLALVDVASGKLLATSTLSDTPTGVDVSADGKMITVKQGNASEKFDAATLKKLP